MVHIPGRKTRVDVLNRLPVPEQNTVSTISEDCRLTDEYVFSVIADAVPAALVPRDVEKTSAEDATFQLVRS